MRELPKLAVLLCFVAVACDELSEFDLQLGEVRVLFPVWQQQVDDLTVLLFD